MTEKTGGFRNTEGRFGYGLKIHKILLQEGKICKNYLHYYIFLSGYVTPMPRCLECEASPQWPPGKSDLTCLSNPKLGTRNKFFLTQNPALVSVTDRLGAPLYCGALLRYAAGDSTVSCSLGFATILLSCLTIH